MRAIFLSYRRDDAEGHAGRLFRDLCERFGHGAVFMDVAGIEPGSDFRRVIDQQVASCGALLAVIGRDWLDARDAAGRRRLDDPLDFVRLETAAALRRDIPVIPVLVHDAAMPRPEQLPDELKELAYRNAVELRHTRWDSDLEILVRALRKVLDAPDEVAAAAGAEPSSHRPEPAAGPAPPPTHAGPARRARPGRQALLASLALVVALGAGGAYWARELAQNRAQVRAQEAARVETEARQRALEQAEREALAAREEAARAKAEAERLTREREQADARAEAERAAREREQAARAAKEKAAAERATAERVQAQRAAAEQAAALAAAQERAAALQAQTERAAAEAAKARADAARLAPGLPAHSLAGIALEPRPPAKLASGDWVRVTFSYTTTQPGGVRVIALPLAGGKPAADRVLRAPALLPTGRGTGSAEFTVKSAVTVDAVTLQMRPDGQKQTLFETTVKALHTFSASDKAVARPGTAQVTIVGSSCTRSAGETYRVEVSGSVRGPARAVLYVWADGIARRPPEPTFEMDCGGWRRITGNGCALPEATTSGTRWIHRREFVASRPPSYAEAVVLGGADTSLPRLAAQRVSLTCR